MKLVVIGTRYLLGKDSEQGALRSLERYLRETNCGGDICAGVIKVSDAPITSKELAAAKELRRRAKVDIFLWDSENRSDLQQQIQIDEMIFLPYGGNHNQAALLQAATKAEFFVKVDRDCCPADNFSEVLESHTTSLNDEIVAISAGSAERYPLTDEFIQEGYRTEWYDLVATYTSIDTRKQMGSGFALTMRDSIPVPTFEQDGKPHLVWGSDDGFLGTVIRVLGKTWSTSNKRMTQPRNLNRKSVSFFASYIPRVTAMVCLSLYTRGSEPLLRKAWDGKESVLSEADEHLNAKTNEVMKGLEDWFKGFKQLARGLDIRFPEQSGDEREKLLSTIRQGVVGYLGTLSRWTQILEAARTLRPRQV